MTGNIEYVGKTLFKVQSNTNPDEFYYVDAKTNFCTCKGFNIRHKCGHLDQIKEYINKKNIEIN